MNSKGLSIRPQLDHGWVVQRDWRDDRIAEIEAELAAKDACIAEQTRRITEQDVRIAALEK